MVPDLPIRSAIIDDACLPYRRCAGYPGPLRKRHARKISTDQAILRTRVSDPLSRGLSQIVADFCSINTVFAHRSNERLCTPSSVASSELGWESSRWPWTGIDLGR